MKAYRERTKEQRKKSNKQWCLVNRPRKPKPTLEELEARSIRRKRQALERGRRAYAKTQVKRLSETPEQREARLSKVRGSKLRWYRSHTAHARAYYSKQRDHILARERKRSEAMSPEAKKAQRERAKRWYEKNKERQKARNLAAQKRDRAGANRRSKAFALRHPERIQAEQMRRRAFMMGAQVGDNLAIREWMRTIRAKPSFKCYYCEQVKQRSELHFDHVIALARGGKHSLDNLAASCAPCNFSKNATLPHEWSKLEQRVLSL